MAQDGYGPGGWRRAYRTFAGVGLLGHGLAVRIIEMRQRQAPWSKAEILQTRTLKIQETLASP